MSMSKSIHRIRIHAVYVVVIHAGMIFLGTLRVELSVRSCTLGLSYHVDLATTTINTPKKSKKKKKKKKKRQIDKKKKKKHIPDQMGLHPFQFHPSYSP